MINHEDLSINVERKKSKLSVCYVGKFFEILPIRKDNYVKAALNLGSTIKMVDWITRDDLKVVNEEIINK